MEQDEEKRQEEHEDWKMPENMDAIKYLARFVGGSFTALVARVCILALIIIAVKVIGAFASVWGF